MNRGRKPDLTVVRGTYPRRILHGTLEVVAAPKRLAPFAVDAVVMEEDTFCVLSADPSVSDPGESLMKIKTRLLEITPEQRGSVIVCKGTPLRFLAIVHDFNEDPSWREEWVADAMDAVLLEADRRGLSAISIPFLGAVYGRMERKRVLELLATALSRFSPHHLKRLWLIVPAGTDPGLLDTLEIQTEPGPRGAPT